MLNGARHEARLVVTLEKVDTHRVAVLQVSGAWWLRLFEQRLRKHVGCLVKFVDISQHLISVVLQDLLVVRNVGIHQLVGLLGIFEVADWVELHDPVSERAYLLHQSLLSLLERASGIVGANRLNVDELNEEHEHMLELFLHHSLHVKHVVRVHLV